MDKKTLKQYRALLREQELNNKAIDRLYDRLDNVPVVAGKVVGSSRNFPYTEVRTTVQMDEPVESDEINRRLKIREDRQEKIRAAVLEIEEFIAGIPDSEIRQVFEMVYIDGMKMSEVADAVHLDKSRISRKISDFIKTQQTQQNSML